jgi:polar amino acid transport system substrate-binding protein
MGKSARSEDMRIHRRSAISCILGSAGLLVLPSLAWAQGTLEAVKKRGTLRVGVTQAPPWFSKDPKTGEWASGVGIFMGRSMADALGAKMETVEVSWGNSIAALQADKIDIMFTIDATPERRQAVDFPASPLLYYSLAVLARDDLPVKAWEDLNSAGVRIAVPQASSMDRFLTEHTSKADIQRFPDNAAAIAAFQSGRVDAVCLFHPPLLAARQKLGRGKIVVPAPVQSQASSTALRKGDAEFVAWIDNKLADYYRSGQTQKWYEQALTDFGLDPKLAPPIMNELLK